MRVGSGGMEHCVAAGTENGGGSTWSGAGMQQPRASRRPGASTALESAVLYLHIR